jgi:sulfur-carrier protein adenylyltransferase/sulfurtransferase
VLGVLPGIIGCLQALETIKLLLSLDGSLIGRMLLFDGLPMEFREIKIRRDPLCSVCGDHPTITEPIDYIAFCGAPATAPAVPAMSVQQFHSQARAGNRFTVIDVREPHEWDIANLAEYGARLIPLQEFDQALATLDLDAPTVIHCRSGARSAKAVRAFVAAGGHSVWNLEGGILAWSDAIDSSKAKY